MNRKEFLANVMKLDLWHMPGSDK